MSHNAWESITVPDQTRPSCTFTVPANIVLQPRLVIADHCMECRRDLGDSFHVVNKVVICPKCFRGRVEKENVLSVEAAE